MIGQTLGPYEVVAKLGEGGMGQVYRARDTKLNRDVAIKVLPEVFASDPDRLARFRREAQVLASLNHPNIGHIYGFEDSGPTHALVLELVEGPTLADVIAERAAQADAAGLPLTEALGIARQIAAALEAAHDQGIVHRDLKPANVKIKDDGTVKVLDFGLAKALAPEAEAAAGSVSNSPTLTAAAFAKSYGGPGTQLGMILGTAAYMSPEQAKGRPVDRRADIWAFGVVLFEILAGRRAFEGDDISDVLASVLKTEPDWTKLLGDLPAPVRRLLGRCLEKDPKRRLRDIGEGMLQLDDGLSQSSPAAGSGVSGLSTIGASAPAVPRAWWRRALPIAATAIVTAVVVWTVSRFVTPAATLPEPMRFEFMPPSNAGLLTSAAHRDMAISHDGRTLVYTTQLGGPALYRRQMGQMDAVPLRGAESAMAPFFSPDDQWVGFLEPGSFTRLKKVPVLGGPSVPVTQTKYGIYGAAWLADGTIVLGMGASGLVRVSANGGDAVELTKVDASRGELTHRWPAAVPGTSKVLFSGGGSGPATAFLAVADVATGTVTRLNLPGMMVQYAPTGHLVFATVDGPVRAVPFDVAQMAVRGSPVPVVEGVAVKGSGGSNFTISRDGTLVYALGSGVTDNRSIVWVDRSGRETPIRAPARNYYYARVSPNGARLSLDIRDQEQDVWIWDDRGTLMRLTADSEPDQYGLWTPDGQHVVFQSNRSQKPGIYVVRADGIGSPRLLVTQAAAFPNAVTPDGKSVIFRAAGAAKNDLFIVQLEGSGTATPLLATEHDELNAAISPDGKWLAYQSDLQGRMDIWVRPFPDVNAGQVLVSTNGGSEPVWAPSGRELFYLSPDDKIMSVAVTAGKELVPSTPTVLFAAASYYFGGLGRNYDVSPDGKRFVMVKNPATPAPSTTPLTFVLNWTTELARVK